MPSLPPPGPARVLRTGSRVRRRRLLFRAVYVAYVVGCALVLVWLGGRLYAWWVLDVPITASPQPQHVLKHYYRGLRRTAILETPVTREDGQFDVLLLGASVLEDAGEHFERRLSERLARPLRVFNVAESAHTTRDTMIKWKYLADKAFDVVVVYHGINDARMNCCPPGEFRTDYSHCQWYRGLEARLAAGRVNLPQLAADRVLNLIDLGEPRSEELLDYGREIKTAGSFRAHLEPIARASQSPDVLVVLMSFASYFPENYTKQAFLAGELDYTDGTYRLPAEIWGRPEAVRATIAVHNGVIRSLAEAYPQVLCVDQAARIPAEGRYFADPCHFSAAGRELFVDNLVSAIVERLERSGEHRESAAAVR